MSDDPLDPERSAIVAALRLLRPLGQRLRLRIVPLLEYLAAWAARQRPVPEPLEEDL